MAAAHRLTDDLRRSRERVVLAREDERRRLRRDLHDELAPLLASFTLQLDAATLRHRRTGVVPPEVLAELRASANDAVATVRRAVAFLRPAALGELGLVSAVSEQLVRLRSPHGPTLTAELPEDLPPLPAAVEVAALRIATEALTNAVRHAKASRVNVRVEPEEHALVVTVVDDGCGMEQPTTTSGVGSGSMRERAEELGGSLTIESSPGRGTRLTARLPLTEVR